MTQDSNNDAAKPEGQLTAWDLETPVSTMFDIRMAGVLESLRRGDVSAIAREIEQGRLGYVARFLTEEDNQRLARALRTGSPLTQAEKRKTRKLEKSRDTRILTRICYWKAVGLPLFSHTSSQTAIHSATNDYSETPIKGAPARTPESVYKHVWLPSLQQAQSLGLPVTRGLLLSFIEGLANSGAPAEVATKRFIWLGERFLSGDKIVPLSEPATTELDALVNTTDPTYQLYREKIAATQHRRTYVRRKSSGQD